MASYELSDKEKLLASDFRRRHSDCTLKDLYKRKMPWWKRLLGFSMNGPYPSHFTYEFTPTGIGVGVDIHCNYCGEIKDITDFDTW